MLSTAGRGGLSANISVWPPRGLYSRSDERTAREDQEERINSALRSNRCADRRRDAPSIPDQIFAGSVSPFFTSRFRVHLATRLNTTVFRSVGTSSGAAATENKME